MRRVCVSLILAALASAILAVSSLRALPTTCALVVVDNQNFNRTVVYLQSPMARLGAVEGFSRDTLKYCTPPVEQKASFVLAGLASSLTVILDGGGARLSPDSPTYLTIGASPNLSTVSGGGT